VFIDDQISGASGYSDLSVVKLPESAYAELVADGNVLSNALYVVEGSYNNAFGA